MRQAGVVTARHWRTTMDVRLAPAEHYDESAQFIDQAFATGEELTRTELFLAAIAHTLQGLLKAHMEGS